MLDPYHQHPEDALKPALEAVEQQPNRATERYMLACALAASGLHADARHELEALRAARNCPACRDALLNAPSDSECSFGPDEVAIASGIAPSPLLVAARAVLASLRSGDPSPALPYLDSSRPALFSLVGLECDRPCGTTQRYARAALIALIRDAKSEYRDPTRMFCDRGCCGGPNPSHTHAPIVHVTELCFQLGGRPRLRSLSAGVDG